MRTFNTRRTASGLSIHGRPEDTSQLTIELLESRQLLSVTPVMLADIGGPGSSISGYFGDTTFVDLDGIAYFRADDGIHGYELWRSDGTEAGTYLVQDLVPGAGDSGGWLTSFEGDLYSISDTKIWRTNVTDADTTLVYEFAPRANGIQSPVVVGDLLFFVVLDGSYDRELWRTDGTTAGTYRVKNIHPTMSSDPTGLTNVNGMLYFAATDQNGRGLWKSDGTEAGTIRLTQPNFPESIGSASLTNVNGTLFFTSDTGVLWTSDGTSEGTYQLPGSAFKLTNFDGTLYFANRTNLYRLDGNNAPQSIMYFGLNSRVGSLMQVDDRLFISVDTPQLGYELWVSDGTTAGTQLVLDIVPGVESSSPQNLTSFAGDLYFTTSIGTHKGELWKSDGTAAGTMVVKDIWPGPDGADVDQLTVIGGKLFFRAIEPEAGAEPWITDGTAAGTHRVRDINEQPDSPSNPTSFTAAGALTYFSAQSLEHGIELWKTDGSAAGTVLVKDISPGRANSTLSQFTEAGGLMYFVSELTPWSPGNLQLWRSDGTAAGTFALMNVGANFSILSTGGKLYFSSNGSVLWTTDGTVAGTQPVPGTKPVSVAPAVANRWSDHLVSVGTSVYYVSPRPAPFHLIHELWRYDLADSTHTKLAELNVVPTTPLSFTLVSAGDLVFFNSFDAQWQSQLWRTDGTQAGTIPLSSVGVIDSTRPASVGGRLYYAAKDAASGMELWTSDGTPEGTHRVADLTPGTGNSDPKQLTAVGDHLYFLALHSTGWRMFQSEGTEAGTALVTSISQSYYGPDRLTNVDGTLYFTLRPVSSVNELWRIEADSTEPEKFATLSTSSLANSNGTLFFAEYEAFNVSEPWILAPPVAARLFYNNSKFDQVAGASGDADDGALAVDKLPYIPGNGRATSENVSSYSKGINGLFIDLAPGHGEITADDFVFRMGTGTDPAAWGDAPAPLSITVRAGAGVAGHDRIEIVFADGAIKNTWLEVTVRGNDARGGFHAKTGLDESTMFYFGSRLGDTFSGNTEGLAATNIADSLQIRSQPAALVASGNRLDINRDGLVNIADELIARNNPGLLLMLNLPPLADEVGSAAPLAAAAPTADPFASAIASALAGAQRSLLDMPATSSTQRMEHRNDASAHLSRAHIAEEMAIGSQDDAETLVSLAIDGILSEESAEHEHLLDALLPPLN